MEPTSIIAVISVVTSTIVAITGLVVPQVIVTTMTASLGLARHRADRRGVWAG